MPTGTFPTEQYLTTCTWLKPLVVLAVPWIFNLWPLFVWILKLHLCHIKNYAIEATCICKKQIGIRYMQWYMYIYQDSWLGRGEGVCAGVVDEGRTCGLGDFINSERISAFSSYDFHSSYSCRISRVISKTLSISTESSANHWRQSFCWMTHAMWMAANAMR